MEPSDDAGRADRVEPGEPGERAERWCPRCEWLGRSTDGPCPACQTPLLRVERADPARPAAAGHAGPAAVPGAAPWPASTEAPAPTLSPGERTPAGVGGPADAGARAARRRAAVVAALAALIAFVLVANLLPGGPSAGPGGTPTGDPMVAAPVPTGSGGPYPVDLPERLAFIVSGLDGGPGSQLYMADGRGANRSAPGAGRHAAWFAWSPDGTNAATVDVGGTLHMVLGGATFPGPVYDAVFSHGGDQLAVCSGLGNPLIHVLGTPALRPSWWVPGCAPSWSPDDAWLAYREPGASGQVPDRLMTLDLRTGRTHRIAGVGPIAWAPAPGYGATPVTSVRADCRAIQLSSPYSRQTFTVAGIPDLASGARAGAAGCPISILSWSPDGRWLAIGAGPHAGVTGSVLLLEPLTHYLVELPQPKESGLTPVAFTWSPDGRLLLVECEMQDGQPFTIEFSPSGDAVTHDIVAGSVSWSPDGRWILGHALNGWVAFAADDPLAWALLANARAGWSQAVWCCPVVPVIGAVHHQGPPGLLRPNR